MQLDPHMVFLIAAAALVTYATRFSGYLMVKTLRHIPPRMEAALNAVPAAVLTTLVAPAFFTGPWETKLALVVALLVGLRFAHIWMVVAAWLVVIVMRHGFGL
ncbi:AzlD family protein [Oryzifoliimicrobium ureilyticus]|uniref:AzlD family protein n=1 Tax=Oryzifoliimicrobium ureilyticus TaxID=3113724 RepID=UPI003075FFE7